MIIVIMTIKERIFLSIYKIWFKKEIILNFYADVSFLFVCFQFFAVLLVFFMKLKKTWKKLIFRRKSCSLPCFSGFFFIYFFLNMEDFLTKPGHWCLDNESQNGVITSNHLGFWNTRQKVVFYLITIKVYF